MHACMCVCVCVCACVCACVRVCVCACVIIGYVRPSLNCAVRPVSFSAFGTGGPAGGRGTVALAGGSKGMAPPARESPTVTVGMPVSGSEPPLNWSRAETCETTDECAALCKSIHRLHSISNSHRLLSCASVCTSHDRRRTNDQRQGPEEQRIKGKDKDKHKVRGSYGPAHVSFEERTIAPKDIGQHCGPRVCRCVGWSSYLELSSSYP